MTQNSDKKQIAKMQADIEMMIHLLIKKYEDDGLFYVTPDSSRLAAQAAIQTLLAISNGWEGAE